VGEHHGWIAVAPDAKKPVLGVEISLSLLPVLSPVLARVKRQFDLSADPRLIASRLGPLAKGREGLRVPGAFDGFETAVRAILGQQVSVRAATTLMGRFARAFGEPVETPVPGLTHLSPTPERVAGAEPGELTALGILSGRAGAVLALARAVAEGRIGLDCRADIERTKAQLRELPGIGEWTAEYVAMRALSWPDAFLHTDLGVRKALGNVSPRRALEAAEEWRPWRAYAVMHLWKSLEEIR
jgi:AraC family transcriptional regulator of adaptative response / DNA-3-methyladenine glycosylase II